MQTVLHPSFSRGRFAARWVAALLLGFAAFAATAQTPDEDPPGRAAAVTARQGGLVFAPQGEDEWVDLPANRPLTTGDKLWTDRGARAEVHLGSAVLHLGSEAQLGVMTLDDAVARFSLTQGAVQARVRDLQEGDAFEIGTPNVAVRVTQPGDYRIDVDAGGRETRVVVAQGMATVFGEGGQAVYLSAGQQATFAGRALAQVQSQPVWQDDLDQWAAARNRAEDQSPSARYVPRGVVGYAQLDAHGTWSQDATHGAVWIPRSTVADWAPYRDGRWEWIGPWGWTWVDDAPWGFAPFHYGRWAMIGNRWAWVPGRLAPRPAYAPALVVFIGGGQSTVQIGGGPGVGWYPLAPGEAWWPWYRASPRYVGFVNPRVDLHRYPRGFHEHAFRQRPYAFTAVRGDDFRPGRGVREHWRPLPGAAFGPGPAGFVPPRPERGERDRPRQTAARLQALPPAAMPQQGAPGVAAPRGGRETWQSLGQQPRREAEPAPGVGRTHRDLPDERPQPRRDAAQVRAVQPPAPAQAQQQPQAQPSWGPRDADAVRDQARAQREQERLQREAQRAARLQQQQQHQQQRSAAPQPAAPAVPQAQPTPAPPQVAAPIGRQRNASEPSARAGRPERGERDGRGEGRGPREEPDGRGRGQGSGRN